MKSKSEKEINELITAMDKYEHFIKDDYQHFGYINFRSGLKYCLGHVARAAQ